MRRAVAVLLREKSYVRRGVYSPGVGVGVAVLLAACATAMAETDEAAPPARHDVHVRSRGRVSRHSYAPHTRTYARSTAPIRLTARTRT